MIVWATSFNKSRTFKAIYLTSKTVQLPPPLDPLITILEPSWIFSLRQKKNTGVKDRSSQLFRKGIGTLSSSMRMQDTKSKSITYWKSGTQITISSLKRKTSEPIVETTILIFLTHLLANLLSKHKTNLTVILLFLNPLST
ncbi:hypothetical protein LIER_38668 [Lithospermum erythrorhizon]|uniref:Uncharacterized protein n=1 Tax=Lithospermum erythrorhizon TaxID=34254 RepID=A0AAV3Q5R6_LITER